MKRLFIVLIIGFAFAQLAPAQDKFKIRIGTRANGAEEFRWEKTADGFHGAGKGYLEQGGRRGETTVETMLAADRTLVRYKLQVQFAQGTQIIEARREGDQVQLSIQAGPQNPTKRVPWKAGIFLLDNMVVSHYQALLDGAPSEDISILVPQAMAIVLGKFRAAGEAEGTLEGKPVSLRKNTLEIGGLLTEIWSRASDNVLMRVFVPLQDVEFAREGLIMAAAPKEEKPKEVVQKNLMFPSGDLQFPATLTSPAGFIGRMPLVVLVHGSGPHDRDETIGPNKPFRDLAYGLASAGIATLRYEKRTYAFRDKMDPLKTTVEEEVIADAVAAVRFARSLDEVDPNQVFLLGHSLGGSLAPFIVQRVPETRGVILLAAAGRPLDDLIVEQTRFQMQRQGLTPEVIDGQMDETKKSFDRIRSKQAKDTERVLGAPVPYWRDLLGRNQLEALKGMRQPILILQGGKDVQVRKADYDLLNSTVKAEAHWFPDLNHLFMTVEGDPTGSEYGRAGKVSNDVINVMASWILKNK
jgi:pimeloyl-ACP methyl ester carboxylesterase